MFSYGRFSGETCLGHNQTKITEEWSTLLRTREVLGLTPATKSATLTERNE